MAVHLHYVNVSVSAQLGSKAPPKGGAFHVYAALLFHGPFKTCIRLRLCRAPCARTRGTIIVQGVKRKVVYVSLYELIAIGITSFGLAELAGQELGRASVAAIASSIIAVIWNLVYNTAFEYWESRQSVRGRSLLRRAAHAIGFELGLVVLLVPLFAWWLHISLWQAFVLDLGLIVFFLIYTFAFNLAFDKVFGLPASALPAQ